MVNRGRVCNIATLWEIRFVANDAEGLDCPRNYSVSDFGSLESSRRTPSLGSQALWIMP